jgi:hypothetical protein
MVLAILYVPVLSARAEVAETKSTERWHLMLEVAR